MLLSSLQSARVNNLLTHTHTHNLNQSLFFAAVLEFNRDSSVLVNSSFAAFAHVLVFSVECAPAPMCQGEGTVNLCLQCERRDSYSRVQVSVFRAMSMAAESK